MVNRLGIAATVEMAQLEPGTLPALHAATLDVEAVPWNTTRMLPFTSPFEGLSVFHYPSPLDIASTSDSLLDLLYDDLATCNPTIHLAQAN